VFRRLAFIIFVLVAGCASPLAAQPARSPAIAAFDAGDYARSVKLQEEAVKHARPGAEAAAALLSLSWYRLFTRDFEGAINAADRAVAMEPRNVVLHTNKAHALMFLGREEEARALYLKYKGHSINNGTAFWENAILQDFAAFKKHGFNSPQMKPIEETLSQSLKNYTNSTLEDVYSQCLSQCSIIEMLCSDSSYGSCADQAHECRRQCALYRH
jgi:tetratricopeptide (TPR) repeat protein